jgi:DNA-binding NarL/FixJ family response regulator
MIAVATPFRCIVADDETVIRDYWQLLLASMFTQVDVRTYATSEEALHWINQDPVNLIVLDIGLRAGQTGLELLKSIRQSAVANASTPILVHSGRDDAEVVQMAMRDGASGFLSKGLTDMVEIKAAIRTVIDGGVCLPAAPLQTFLREMGPRNVGTRSQVIDTVSRFAHRQRQVAALMYLGHTEGAIADRLGLASRDSVRTHIRAIYRLLGVYSRAQFMALLGTHVIKIEHFEADF